MADCSQARLEVRVVPALAFWWIGVAAAEPFETAGVDLPPGRWLPARGDGPAPVVNGDPVTGGADHVVALAGQDPVSGQAYVFCTGSLVTDTWVLTAAHCISGSLEVEAAGLDLVVLFGDDMINVGFQESIPWIRGIEDPSYSPAQFIHDAGLVELARARRGTRWMVLRDEPLDDSIVGTEMTFYGFGITSDAANDGGIKRTTTIPVAGFDAYNIDTYDPTTNLCSGDSGGPGLHQGPTGPEQAGINAFVEGSCVGGRTGSTRVDNHIEWIRGYVPEVALDAADLPRPPTAGGGDDGEGRAWDDLGADRTTGLAGQWADGAPVPRSCSVAPAPGWGTVAGVAVLATLSRRRRSSRPRTA